MIRALPPSLMVRDRRDMKVSNVQAALRGGAHVALNHTQDVAAIADKEGVVETQIVPHGVLLLGGGILRQDGIHRVAAGQIHGPEDEKGRQKDGGDHQEQSL